MKKTIFYSFLLGFIINSLNAQIDDIQQLINTANNSAENTQKVDLLVQIGDRLLLTDAKKAQNYGEQALKLAKKLQYEAGQAKAQFVTGKAHLQQNRIRKGIDYLKDALPWIEKNGDSFLLYDLYFQLAKAYQLSNKPTEVELYRQKYNNLKQRQENMKQQQENLSNQERMKLLELESLANKDSAFMARLNAVEAQMMRDSALQEISERDAALLQQQIELTKLEKDAAEFKQQKAESELRLQQEQQKLAAQRQRLYWVLAAFGFVLVLGLSAWFFYQSRQAQKLAKMERLEAERLRILTAGIAHEIKNPLNFVNNFAEGSIEIVAELEEALAENKSALIAELVGELKQNSVDIRKNGQRVHQIVQSMSDYASGGKSERQATDLNQLLDENINLAYHGYRAQHPNFIANIERKYDALTTPVEVIPQEIGRVFLNLVNNACYALQQKQKEMGTAFTPTLTVTTTAQNGEAIVRIRDNGTGIPKEVLDKIFTPFFTTKPTGMGNAGLGLSMSYEIVTQHHQGNLAVDTKPGEFTEFIIRLPKNTREV